MAARRFASLALAACCLGTPGARAEAGSEQTPSPPLPISAGGRLGWIFSNDLDLLGGLWVDIPRPLTRGGTSIYLALETTTAIRRAQSFTFDVRDLEYVGELGLRAPRAHVVVSGFVQQWGKEYADNPGEPFARSLGLGLETPGYHRRERNEGVEGRAKLGAVVGHRALDAAGVFDGDLRYAFSGSSRVGVSLEARVQALAGSGSSSADFELGPRLDLFLAPERRASFFLHYYRGGTPLGLETSGFILGYDDSEGPGLGGGSAPDVRGIVAAGVGEAGGMGRLVLSFLSPPFTRAPLWVRGDFDLNVLTAEDSGDLYYVYRIGVETSQGGATEGVYFHHRSNHALARHGTVTSIDVLEAGISTPGWSQPQEIREPGRFGALDAAVRVGVLLETSFGKSGRPHAAAGIRWILPVDPQARFLPYALVEVEDGQVGSRLYGIGALQRGGLDLRLEYLSDEQLQNPDEALVLAVAGLSF